MRTTDTVVGMGRFFGTRPYSCRVFIAGCLAGNAICQTQVDLRTQSKNIDFTAAIATKPFKSGTALPAICSTAETFFNVNAAPGQNLYVCTSLNTWTPATASGGNSGITSLNGLASSSQTFTNDVNVSIVSGGTAHVITWSGALAKSRQNPVTVYRDQANTYSGAFVQDFSAISHLRLPVAAGYTPITAGQLGYDSTNNVYKGFNGSTVKTLAFVDSNITGNAATATAFTTIPSKCPTGNYPLGIDSSGNAQNCTAPTGNGDSAGQTIVPFAATPTYAIRKNTFESQRLTLTADITSSTLTVASGTPFVQLSLCQDGTGHHANVWPTNVNGAPVINPDGNSCTNIGGTWDGSTLNVQFYSVTSAAASPAFLYQIGGNTYTQSLAAQDGTVADISDIGVVGNQPINTRRRACSMLIGSDNGPFLADADIGPQGEQCRVHNTATIVELVVNADANTPSVLVAKRHCSTYTGGTCSAWAVTNILSSALTASIGGFDACSNVAGTTSIDGGTVCSATLQNTSLLPGDWIELASGTAAGAKRLSIDVTYLVTN